MCVDTIKKVKGQHCFGVRRIISSGFISIYSERIPHVVLKQSLSNHTGNHTDSVCSGCDAFQLSSLCRVSFQWDPIKERFAIIIIKSFTETQSLTTCIPQMNAGLRIWQIVRWDLTHLVRQHKG